MVKWRSVEYARELSVEDARGALSKTLCRDWIRSKTKNRDRGAIISALNRMHFVVFERVSTSEHNKLKESSFGILTNSDRAIATSKAFERSNSNGEAAPPIYCIGCSEKIKTGFREHSVTIKTRVFMLGFISETSDIISLGIKISSGNNMRMHGVQINDDFIVYNLSSLSFDLEGILNEEIKGECELTLSPVPMNLDTMLPGLETLVEDTNEEEEGELSSHIYVFSWDPPTIDDMDFLTKEISLEKETLDRVEMLCSLSIESNNDIVKPNESAWKRDRDRACMHMLVLCMCWSPELIDWYVSAEDCMLREQLTLLCDPSDVKKTFKSARIFLDKRNISFWNDNVKIMRDTQERRLRTAIEYASKNELPESIRDFAVQCVDYISATVPDYT